MNRVSCLIVLVAALTNLSAWAWWYQAREAPDWTGGTIAGISYSPYTRGQDPAKGDLPRLEAIVRDLDLLQHHTSHLRTYSAIDALQHVPSLAAARGIAITAGAWIGKDTVRNRREIDSLIKLANSQDSVVRTIVGNEALLRGDITANALINMISEVRQRTGKPVSTAEPWHVWLDNPALAAAVDFVGVQILPYWEGVPADDAVPYLFQHLKQLQARYPGKPVVVTEVGWPSEGRPLDSARANRVDQATFLRTFLNRAQGLDYFVIEAFDQPWKISIEGMAGGYWGLFDVDRHPKFSWIGPLQERDDWLVWALLATLAALVPAVLYARVRPNLRPRGALLATGVCTAAGSALIAAFLPTITFYLSGLEFAIWAVLFGAALFLAACVFVDAIEASDLVGNGSLRRRFAGAPPTIPRAKYPKVTIHVPIHKEPPAMVRRTLNTLAAIDYPNFEVIVLDNNTDDPALWQPVEAHCRSLGGRFHFHRYSKLAGFKGGALNRALTHSVKDAEIVAVIDSDYTVDRDWLKALVPLLDDPKIGYVQAPQDYRDQTGSLFKRFCFWEYAGFFRIGMVRRNEDDAIIQHGTMTLIRREALESVGGWAEWCITEDAELGLRFAHTGWQSAYVAKSYGRGLTPDGLSAYKSQRFRWAYGAMQILKRRWRWLITGKNTKLARAQRFHYLAGWLPWLSDAAGLLFTAGAVLWSAAVILSPEKTELPVATFLLSTLAAFIFRQWRFFALYSATTNCPVSDRIRAALAGLALSHTVAKAVIWGLFTSERPFLRTPKYRSGPGLRTGLAMASEEAIILAILIAITVGFVATNGLWHFDAWLWLAILIVLSLPYAATVLLGAINGLPPELRRRAPAGGPAPLQPAFPPTERRGKRKP